MRQVAADPRARLDEVKFIVTPEDSVRIGALLAGQAPDISPATARRTIWVIRLELLLLVCLPFLASLMARGVGYSS